MSEPSDITLRQLQEAAITGVSRLVGVTDDQRELPDHELRLMRRQLTELRSQYSNHSQEYYLKDRRQYSRHHEEFTEYSKCNDIWRLVYLVWLLALTGIVIYLLL